jgi:hypothetical protein
VGLLLYGQGSLRGTGTIKDRKKGFFSKFKDLFKEY